MNFTQRIYFLLICFLVFVLVCLNFYQYSSNKKETNDYINLITAIEDTLTIEKNKNGQYVSSIAVLHTENTKTFTQLKIKNKEIQELQKTVKQYGKKLESLTKFESRLKFDTVTKTETEFIENSFVYKWQFIDEWINIFGTSNENNTQFSLQIKEKYDIAIVENKKQLEIQITNYNPYSITNKIQSFYKDKPKQKKIGIGFYAGYGYNFHQEFGFEVGIGINYNIFYLW